MVDAIPATLSQVLSAIVAYWLEGWRDITGLTFAGFFEVFWFLVVFDIPRYVLPDIVMLVFIVLRWVVRWPKRPVMDRSYEPSVSVLIPAYNEADHAAKTVRSMLEQDYPIAEIVVVDDGSRDDTSLYVKPFLSDPRVQLIRNAVRGGKASALQTALAATTGEIVISCDADTTFDRDAVRWLVQYLRDPEVGCVSGNVKVRNRTATLATWFQAAEYEIAISVGRRVLGQLGWLTVVSGAFGAFRREVLESGGAWDPGIGDDSNVTLKVRKKRLRVAFAPEAVCLTDAPESWRVLWRQRRRWDKSGYRNRLRKHVGLLNPFKFGFSSAIAIYVAVLYRIVLLMLFLFWFFYDLLILHRGQLAWIFMVTFVIYGVANFISLLVAWGTSERKDEWQLLWLAPVLMFYHWFLRIPRALSTIEEMLGVNYRQRFYPDAVWEQAPRW